MILLLTASSLLLFTSVVFAQSGTLLDLGGGMSTFNDSSGRSGTIIDLGGGIKSYNDNRGVSGTILDLGGGMQTYQFTTPPAPLIVPPSNAPIPRATRSTNATTTYSIRPISTRRIIR